MSRKPLHHAVENSTNERKLLLFKHGRIRRRATQGAKRDGGASRDRTDDLKLAKLPLSQLSYGPDPNDNNTPKALFHQPTTHEKKRVNGGPGKI